MEIFIPIRVDGEIMEVPYSEILYVEAVDKYLHVITTFGSLMARASLNSFETLLPDDQFLRIHRKFLISIPHIKSFNSKQVVVGSVRLTVARRFRKRFNVRIKERYTFTARRIYF